MKIAGVNQNWLERHSNFSLKKYFVYKMQAWSRSNRVGEKSVLKEYFKNSYTVKTQASV